MGAYPESHVKYNCMNWRRFIEIPRFSIKGQYLWDHSDGDLGYMTQQKKEAYSELGYLNSDKWDERQIPDVFSKPWSLLTIREQSAATFLSYNEEIWNGCKTTTPCIWRKLYAEQVCRPIATGESGRLWANFGSFTTDNFGKMGWTRESWNDGGPYPAAVIRSWDELPAPIQQIAKGYGFERETWNGCPDTPCLDKYRYIEAKYNVNWRGLSPRIQRTLKFLGWEKGLWDEKISVLSSSSSSSTYAVPDLYRRQWSTLTADEQRHAEFLDYDSFTWNGCAGANAESRVVTTPPPDGLDPYRRIRARLFMPRSFSHIMLVEPSKPSTPAPNFDGEDLLPNPNSDDSSYSSRSESSETSDQPEESSHGFILVAQQAIARALFCNNPDFDAAESQKYGGVQRGPDGLPLCMDRNDYDRQIERISILSVSPGIRLDFEIAANRTEIKNSNHHQGMELSALDLYNRLALKVTNPQSDFRADEDFKPYAQVAQLSMIAFDEDAHEVEQRYREFEVLRKQYDKHNACELFSDEKNGVNMCWENGGCRRVIVGGVGVWALVSLILTVY